MPFFPSQIVAVIDDSVERSACGVRAVLWWGERCQSRPRVVDSKLLSEHAVKVQHDHSHVDAVIVVPGLQMGREPFGNVALASLAMTRGRAWSTQSRSGQVAGSC